MHWRRLTVFSKSSVTTRRLATILHVHFEPQSGSLADQADSHHLALAVNAFHGHAHNRMCQLVNHCIYLPGFGLEDLETCEQIFSSSNSVARVVRFSSYFHWLQFLVLHFDQWDQDRYLELSMSHRFSKYIHDF